MKILLLVCDTTRLDHLSCYGYFRETTPHMDTLAKDGVVFEDFYDAGSPTGPAFTCMYTGLHAIRHKYYAFVQPNVREVNDVIFTMPEILGALGYTTAAVDSNIGFPSHSKHWVRGYNFYLNPTPEFGVSLPNPRSTHAECVNKMVTPWIRDHSNETFFLFVHYWSPHAGFDAPQEYRGTFHHEKGNMSDLKVLEAPAGYQYVPGWGKVGEFVEEEANLSEEYIKEAGREKDSIDLYDGRIRYVDEAIGEVISTLEDEGILDDTLIILTSDHGEHLGQSHNIWGHTSLYDTMTHVPLILRYLKKLPRGIRVKGFGQHIDLLPTILEIIGAPTHALDIDGQSLLPLLKGETIRNILFMEHTNIQRAVRTEKWKLISDMLRGTLELYDVQNDPLESVNLLDEKQEKARELTGTLDNWVRSNLREGERDPVLDSLSFEGRESSRLRMEYKEKKFKLLDSFKNFQTSRS